MPVCCSFPPGQSEPLPRSTHSFLHVPRARAHPDLSADRHLGIRRPPGGGMESDDLSGLRQLRSPDRLDRPLPQPARERPHLRHARGSPSWPRPARPNPAPTVYLLLLLGFGILVSLFPFPHLGPQAYASAPAPAAMLHAGVLKKFGLYGILRLVTAGLSAATSRRHSTPFFWFWSSETFSTSGIVTISQRKLDLMLGYASVMHMGYLFLGLLILENAGPGGRRADAGRARTVHRSALRAQRRIPRTDRNA